MIDKGAPTEQIIKEIPYSFLIFNPVKDIKQVMNYCSGLFLSVALLTKLNSMYGPLIKSAAESRSVLLEGESSGKIVLFLEVEDTLLHLLSSEDSASC